MSVRTGHVTSYHASTGLGQGDPRGRHAIPASPHPAANRLGPRVLCGEALS